MTGSGAASGNSPSSTGSAPWRPAHFSRWVLPARVPLTASGLNHTPSSPRDPTRTYQPREGTAGKPSSIHSTTLYCMLSSLHPENRQSDYLRYRAILFAKTSCFPHTWIKSQSLPRGLGGWGGWSTTLTSRARTVSPSGHSCHLYPAPPAPATHTLSFKQAKNSKTTRP